MNTHSSTPAVIAIGLALLVTPSARSARETTPQVQIEAKFAEVTQSNLKELGFDWVSDFNTSLSPQVLQPGGVRPQSLGTFEVNPPRNLPPTGDIKVVISPETLRHLLGASPLVTMASAQRAVTDVLRDLKVTPRISSDRTGIEMNLVPEATEVTPWSVDLFGTVAFGQVGGTERTTRNVTIRETRIVDVPTTVLVPFDNGNQIVDREETRLVPTEVNTKRTESVSERRDINRLGDAAGGGGLRVNYMFNPYVGLNVRGEVLGGRDTLGLVTGSIFGEYPCCWPVTPTYSVGGGVLFPNARAVMDFGLGLKRRVTPGFDVFSEVHLITDFGRTTFGELQVGARFPLGPRPVRTSVDVGSGQTMVTGGGSERPDRVPLLGNIPVLAHVFRERSGEMEKRNLIIFVTPRIVNPAE